MYFVYSWQKAPPADQADLCKAGTGERDEKHVEFISVNKTSATNARMKKFSRAICEVKTTNDVIRVFVAYKLFPVIKRISAKPVLVKETKSILSFFRQ